MSKRFFECGKCRNHISVLNERLPSKPCDKCGAASGWKEAGMRRTSKASTAADEFLARGVEHGKFLNSSVAGGGAAEANFFQSARRQLQDEGGFEAFRAELKPLVICLKAARHLESPSLVRAEMERALDAVHALLVRLALGGLHEEFAAYVPAEGREYWRTLASTGKEHGRFLNSSVAGGGASVAPVQARPQPLPNVAYSNQFAPANQVRD